MIRILISYTPGNSNHVPVFCFSSYFQRSVQFSSAREVYQVFLIMTTLEDTFLDDLEDSEDEGEFVGASRGANVDEDSDDSLDDLINHKDKKETNNKPKEKIDTEAELFADMEALVDIDLIESKNEPLMTGTPVEAVSDILNSKYLKKHIEIIESNTSPKNKNEKEDENDNSNSNNNNSKNKNNNSNDDIDLSFEEDISIKTDDYSMINSCNNLAVEIDNNILKIDKFIKNIYSKKFPELEGMVTNPIEYAKCVKILANKSPEVEYLTILARRDCNSFILAQTVVRICCFLFCFLKNTQEMSDAPLNSVLINKTLPMMIQISATTTSGKTLDASDLERVLHATDVLFELNLKKEKILNYITLRVNKIAPNLCEFIGPSLTSKLIIMVGSIEKLSKMAASNVQNVGSIKRNQSNFNGGNAGFAVRMANVHTIKAVGTEQSGLNPIGLTSGSGANLNYYETTPHFGIISQSDMVRNCPTHTNLKRRALRQVACKVVLCARIDATLPRSYTNSNNNNNTNTNNNNDMQFRYDNRTLRALSGEIGKGYRTEVLNKISKWQEPPPPKPPRPLSIPDNKPKKKRGGKRYRKMREKYKITEMQKLSDRMAFGTPEQEFINGNGEIVGLGMLTNADDVSNNMGKFNKGAKLRATVETGKKMSQQSELQKWNRRQIAKQRRLHQQRNKHNTQGAGMVSGLKTSLQFGSQTGIELSNPELLKNQSSKKNRHTYFDDDDIFSKRHDDD